MKIFPFIYWIPWQDKLLIFILHLELRLHSKFSTGLFSQILDVTVLKKVAQILAQCHSLMYTACQQWWQLSPGFCHIHSMFSRNLHQDDPRHAGLNPTSLFSCQSLLFQ